MTKMRNLDDHRICFVGDSFVLGAGDPECRGWVGRICASARRDGHDVTAYNLGIRRDTSRDIALRWESECRLRFRQDSRRYVLFSFGVNDMTMENGSLRVPVEESIANFARIISTAKALYEVLVVGPGPVGEAAQDRRVFDLCKQYARCAKQMNVPYLAVAETLAASTVWTSEASTNDGAHPGAGGYQLLAELVAVWPAWWFRTEPATHGAIGHTAAR